MSKSVVTSRRSFIKGAVAGAVSAGVAPVMAAPAPQNGLPAKWDGEADVVIVGFGGAGATTGIVAAQNGAKVIILEKNPQNHHYSNTRMSGGIFHCPFKDGDPKALKDYAQAMFSGENIDWKEEGEIPEYSEGLAQLWADLSPTNLEFLQSLDPAFIGGSQPGFNKASFPNFPGAKECKYNAYRATYQKRMKNFNQKSVDSPKEETSSGEAFWRCLEEGVKKQGDNIKVYYETPACSLLKNAKGEVGIVRGLAWTQAGGDTLEIEVITMPGKGEFKLTGNMGDVMKESASIAVSYIRSVTEKGRYKVDAEYFQNHAFHLHIPEGATPKDGPSAGITMATAVLSAVTGIPVRADVAMTGELTLRGKVLPIGGLKEKLLASKTAGITNVFVPRDNRSDVEELDTEITEGMNIIYVNNAIEVFAQALMR